MTKAETRLAEIKARLGTLRLSHDSFYIMDFKYLIEQLESELSRSKGLAEALENIRPMIVASLINSERIDSQSIIDFDELLVKLKGDNEKD